jgi:hypothetical protein
VRPLEKGPEPQVLVTSGARLRRAYLDAVTRGDKPLPSPWRHRQIRDALQAETFGRCAYCEGDILAVSFGDIEHHRPRVRYPALVVEWSNLTLACSRCNNSKSSKWDDALPYVNPYEDEIEQHIVFIGPFARGVSARGIKTIKDIGLNIVEKAEARQRQIDGVIALYSLWAHAIPEAQPFYAEQIKAFIESSPYSASVMAMLRATGFPTELVVA